MIKLFLYMLNFSPTVFAHPPIKEAFMLFILLLAMWLILNSRITLEVILFGVVISGALSWFCRRQRIWPRWIDRSLFRLSGKILLYLWRLLGHIISSSLTVCRIILTPGLEEVQPKLLFFEPDLDEVSTRVVLGNSITLTPGTFTVGIYGDSILCVHALNGDMVEGTRHLDLTPRLKDMEKVIREERQNDTGKEKPAE